MKKRVRVCVIEDNYDYFDIIKIIFDNEKNVRFDIEHHDSIRDGIECLKNNSIDVILLDLYLPDSKGLEGFKKLKEIFPHIPIVILTSVNDRQMALESITEGAQDYLVKGEFNHDLLARVMCYAIERKEVEKALRKAYQENHKSKEKLREDEKHFRSLVSNIPGAVYRYKIQNADNWKIEFMSFGVEDISGYTVSNFIGASIDSYLKMILPEDVEKVKVVLKSAAEDGFNFSLDYKIRHAGGSIRCMHEQGRGFKEGKVGWIDGAIFDVTERTKTKEKLNYLSCHDALTGLPNRMIFWDRLSQAIGQARTRNKHAAVLFVDLDQFKRINDALGHEIGDGLIRAVSNRLRIVLYNTDTITRIGGDGFIILLPEIEKVEYAENVANKILSSFKTPFKIKEHELFVNCSIGIGSYPNDGEQSEILMKNTDLAMHVAKEKGGEQYQLYSVAIGSRVSEKLKLENKLRHALEKNEFKLHYQPQIDLKTGRVTGVEALIRWYNPDMGLVAPMQFIPLAEKNGLIHPIGEWVLRTACAQKKKWQDEGLEAIKMAVNLSGRQFHYANLLELVTQILKKTNLNPEMLDLELTESTVMQYSAKTLSTLQGLKDMGIRITIDDFGTGFSSLLSLKKFPINTIKIDRMFIKDVIQNNDDSAITRAIISMAHNLRMDVIAEGVETESQLTFLQGENCDKMQGFLFSKPLPADEIKPFLESSR